MKKGEQLGATLSLVDAADVQREVSTDVVLLSKSSGLGVLRRVDARADDNAWDLRIAGDRLNQGAFLGGVVDDRSDAAKDVVKGANADGLIALGARDENR